MKKQEEDVVKDPSTTPQTIALGLPEIEAMMTRLVTEMKKPTEEQLAAKEVEKQKQLKLAESRIAVGKAEEHRRTAQQSTCNHKRDNGRSAQWAVSGQAITGDSANPPKGVLICLRCQKLFEFPLTQEFLQGIPANIELRGLS